MKVVAKKVEMIAHFKEDGKIKPLRFKIEEENKCEVIRIQKIISIDLEKLCGNKMLIYTCTAIINNQEKIFELKYDLEGCKWILFKI
ncbi:hypothetical protein [Clostridium sp. Maddingley MBC34-26]|uniref:hypothetical protein n=1 Tax=Clostridium sp. Maddingley MBC34-26 TaxID=1196322 RepID=UPI0002980B1C|nr:hypothetical protein [Clostridium sp. Maddingley MBC34-26]EKQ52691.1 MAG: hypothetical protein A370_04112 [Clostridium sp. Maddingley MBC34-26]